jgi:hypothetical protein
VLYVAGKDADTGMPILIRALFGEHWWNNVMFGASIVTTSLRLLRLQTEDRAPSMDDRYKYIRGGPPARGLGVGIISTHGENK